MKINLSLALAAAVAMAVAASPSEAATKKKAKATKAKVTVTKSQPYFVSNWNACASTAATWWFPFAVIGTVGCGVVYAIPVGVEGFVVPQGGNA